MKKAWPYISTFLLGVIAGLIAGVKWLGGADYHIEVKKIKNKRVGQSETTIPIKVEKRKR